MQLRLSWPSLAAPIGVLLIAMISIQGGASLAKQLFPAVGAEGATSLRLAFAALMMMVVWRPWRSRFTFRRGWPVILYGIALGAMNLMFYMALRTVPLGVAVGLEFTGPLVVAIAGSRQISDFLWIALAVGGLMLLLPLSRSAGAGNPLGAGLALGAGLCWGLYIILGKSSGKLYGGYAVTLGTIVAAIVVAPFGIARAGTELFALHLVPLALIVGLLTSAIPYSLEMVALRRLPAKTFGLLTSVEPAIGVLSGLLFLGEHLTAAQLIGIGAILAASIGTVASIKDETSIVV